ncbi:hypothetical protein IC621_22915 [Bacillus sp. IB182487]|uniref:Uncharacterized protein n=1 Tax=Metabacillus arenae TaxID=2771434 RepID=A0A926RYL0_9BACI|nr:hypothetical protein [Metabacillus arenae]
MERFQRTNISLANVKIVFSPEEAMKLVKELKVQLSNPVK